jgi:hypothetical protein
MQFVLVSYSPLKLANIKGFKVSTFPPRPCSIANYHGVHPAFISKSLAFANEEISEIPVDL